MLLRIVMGMGDDNVCEHQKVPIDVATGRRLDMDREDLGFPDDPELWSRLYRNCGVGVLVCADCAETSPKRFLYLRERRGHREVCTYGLERVIAAGLGESDEHHALKDKVCELACRQGLTAEQEVAGGGGQRRTDVVVLGGVAPVGWEVQLSAIHPDQLRRRIRLAVDDGDSSG